MESFFLAIPVAYLDLKGGALFRLQNRVKNDGIQN